MAIEYYQPYRHVQCPNCNGQGWVKAGLFFGRNSCQTCEGLGVVAGDENLIVLCSIPEMRRRMDTASREEDELQDAYYSAMRDSDSEDETYSLGYDESEMWLHPDD